MSEEKYHIKNRREILTEMINDCKRNILNTELSIKLLKEYYIPRYIKDSGQYESELLKHQGNIEHLVEGLNKLQVMLEEEIAKKVL